MRSVLVVGGGIAGLVAARAMGNDVRLVVVEQGQRWGGLLHSVQGPEGADFDQGTHVLTETGDPDVDRGLLEPLARRDWKRFGVLRAGTFFRGNLGAKSGFLDARRLPSETLAAAVRELEAAKAEGTGIADDLQEQCVRDYGETLTRELHAPVIRKQFGCSLQELLPDNPFLLRRVIVFDPETTRQRKKDAWWNARIAFNTFEEGVGPNHHWYPKRGGVGQFPELLVQEIRAAGGQTILGQKIVAIERGSPSIATLSGGQRIPFDELVWTAPLSALTRLLDLKPPTSAPRLRSVGLLHLAFARPFLVDNHFITCYDDDLRTFRVTLYPNLQQRPRQPPFNCTVELLGDSPASVAAKPEAIVAELVKMGVVEASNPLLSSASQVIGDGFPLLQKAFVIAVTAQLTAVQEALPGVTVLGRSKLRPFFMDEVMRESYRAGRSMGVPR